MPLIRSIDILADGIRVVTTGHGTLFLTATMIPAPTQAAGLQASEDWCNATIAAALAPYGMYGAIKLTQISPLVCNATVSSTPLDANWWQ
jgi:hypothetical protein